MREASGQLPDRFHFPRLPQGLMSEQQIGLSSLLIGDLARP